MNKQNQIKIYNKRPGVVFSEKEKHNIQLALLSRVCDKNNYRAGGFHWKSL